LLRHPFRKPTKLTSTTKQPTSPGDDPLPPNLVDPKATSNAFMNEVG
jgi:hypothetical protein